MAQSNEMNSFEVRNCYLQEPSDGVPFMADAFFRSMIDRILESAFYILYRERVVGTVLC